MAITIPVVAPEFKIHKLRIPVPRVPKVNKEEVSSAGRTAAGYLPPKDQFAYYAGLGALAAFGVIEWPVVLRRPKGQDRGDPGNRGRGNRKEEPGQEVLRFADWLRLACFGRSLFVANYRHTAEWICH